MTNQLSEGQNLGRGKIMRLGRLNDFIYPKLILILILNLGPTISLAEQAPENFPPAESASLTKKDLFDFSVGLVFGYQAYLAFSRYTVCRIDINEFGGQPKRL